MKKIIALIIGFYFLAITQTSFLVHYEFRGAVLNLVLISIILVSFFESKEKRYGLIAGLVGGFYLDIFSSFLFGIFILLGAAVYLLITILKPFFETRKPISFIIILFSALLFYELMFSLITFNSGFNFNIFAFLTNFLAGLIIYFLIKFFYGAYQKKIRKTKN